MHCSTDAPSAGFSAEGALQGTGGSCFPRAERQEGQAMPRGMSAPRPLQGWTNRGQSEASHEKWNSICFLSHFKKGNRVQTASFRSLSFSHCPTESFSSLCLPLSFFKHHSLLSPGSLDHWIPGSLDHSLRSTQTSWPTTTASFCSQTLWARDLNRRRQGQTACLHFTTPGAPAGKAQRLGALQSMGLGSWGGSSIHKYGGWRWAWAGSSVGCQPGHPHGAIHMLELPHGVAASV